MWRELCSWPVEVADRIGRTSASLTKAERRVAEVVLANPQLVAFGTVAELAEGAGSGAATVVRLATKLGFVGFSALQASVQQDLASQLRPAAERIRDPAVHDSLHRHLQIELGNVQTTLGAIDQVALADVVDHLADPARRVYVLSGDASKGVAAQFVGDLEALRANVTAVEGNDVAVRRTVALMEENDVLVTVDLRRYDRWLVDVARTAAKAGVFPDALTGHGGQVPLAGRLRQVGGLQILPHGPLLIASRCRLCGEFEGFLRPERLIMVRIQVRFGGRVRGADFFQRGEVSLQLHGKLSGLTQVGRELWFLRVGWLFHSHPPFLNEEDEEHDE